jgi:hypothetical protein
MRALALLWACALAGCAGAAHLRLPPDWVSRTPEPDGRYFYFTGSGTSASGDLAQSEESARQAVLTQIMQYLGVEVTLQSTGTLRGPIDSLTRDIEETIVLGASGRIAGLELADRWEEESPAGVTEWLLVRYAEADLEKEKRRVAAIFAERQEELAKAAERLGGLIEEGRTLLDQGEASGAIARFLEALAAAAGKGDLGEKGAAIVRLARSELARAGSMLSLGCGEEWAGDGGAQLSAGLAAARAPRSLFPSVVLTTREKGTPVEGVQIDFETVKGRAAIAGSTVTDRYGRAACPVGKIETPKDGLVVRASAVGRRGPVSFPFEGLRRDFVYLPLSASAALGVLQRSPLGSSGSPEAAATVLNRLRALPIAISSAAGSTEEDVFEAAFLGDPKATARLCGAGTGYLILVLCDCSSLRQLSLDGKAYDLYRSSVSAAAKVLRVADGTILYSAAVPEVSGQGGSAAKAAADGLRKALTAVAERIGEDVGRIRDALAAEGL